MATTGILNSFLLNSPPGELNTVYQDVQGLLGPNKSSYSESDVEAAFHQYNTENLFPVSNGGSTVLLSKYNSLGGRQFIDVKNGQIITYDHVNQKIIDTSLYTVADMETEPWRVAMQAEAEKYVNNYFVGVTANVFSCPSEGSQLSLAICISGLLLKTVAFYSGRWTSIWTVKFTPGKTSDLVGTVKSDVHYFEGGNVQLNTNVTKSKKGIPAPNPQGLAENIMGTVNAIETDFQNQLELNFENMGQTTFKACRRALPIDGRKIRWSQITGYKLGADLNAK